MRTKRKWIRLLAIALVPMLALVAGCAEDTGDEDVGQGIDEPQEDAGPVEESVQPATEDEVGGDEGGGFEQENGAEV